MTKRKMERNTDYYPERNTEKRSGKNAGKTTGRNVERNTERHTEKTAARRPRKRSSLSYRSMEEPEEIAVPYKKKVKKKRKKAGCLFPIIILVLAVIGIFLGLTFLLRSSFAKIENYELNSAEMVLVEEDANMDDYQTIALFGVDDQDNTIKDYGSRSDSIIVTCINKKTKEIKLMSIYRDTYVSIDGEYDKINAAYSYGGPELAISTINRNIDLNISDFLTVNFKALADAVDVLGGIPLTVESETELNNLNDYIQNMNKINGGYSSTFEASSFPFTATFDGNQAVAYSRIRYMEGGDHARANHQRIVLSGIASKLKSHPWKIRALVNTVLPQCKTSLSSGDMTSLCLALMQYEIVDSQAYPFEGNSVDLKYNGIYYGFPLTAQSNAVMAHEYLFGTKDYQVSEELSLISQKIQWLTEDFGY